MKGKKMILLGGLLLLLVGGNVYAEEGVTDNTNSDEGTQTAVMYVKTTTYEGGLTVDEEITEEEYNQMGNEPDIMPLNTIETNAKKLSLTMNSLGGGKYRAILTTTWKSIPKVKSFDVTAMRFDCFNASYDSSTTGRQLYDGHSITYSNGGTNMKKFANGFGISMNIVDSTSSNLSTYLQTIVSKPSACSSGKIYATYQHATKNVTLAQSQSYTISSSGKGSVIKFNTTAISDTYDSTPGLHITQTF